MARPIGLAARQALRDAGDEGLPLDELEDHVAGGMEWAIRASMSYGDVVVLDGRAWLRKHLPQDRRPAADHAPATDRTSVGATGDVLVAVVPTAVAVGPDLPAATGEEREGDSSAATEASAHVSVEPRPRPEASPPPRRTTTPSTDVKPVNRRHAVWLAVDTPKSPAEVTAEVGFDAGAPLTQLKKLGVVEQSGRGLWVRSAVPYQPKAPSTRLRDSHQDDAVLAYVLAHPGCRSIEAAHAIGREKTAAVSRLQHLALAGEVRLVHNRWYGTGAEPKPRGRAGNVLQALRRLGPGWYTAGEVSVRGLTGTQVSQGLSVLYGSGQLVRTPIGGGQGSGSRYRYAVPGTPAPDLQGSAIPAEGVQECPPTPTPASPVDVRAVPRDPAPSPVTPPSGPAVQVLVVAGVIAVDVAGELLDMRASTSVRRLVELLTGTKPVERVAAGA